MEGIKRSGSAVIEELGVPGGDARFDSAVAPCEGSAFGDALQATTTTTSGRIGSGARMQARCSVSVPRRRRRP